MEKRLDNSIIRDLPPFHGMDDATLRDLLSHARSKHVARGQNVFSQGQATVEFFLLLDGHIRVVKLTQDGEQVVPRYFSAGDLFGIGVAIGLDVYPASAEAVTDCVVLCWPSSLWPEITQRHPAFATNTYATVGERLAATQMQLVELATERVEQRVANAILKLAYQTGRKTREGIVIEFPVSRQDISQMTGTTLHTVSRLLSAWETKGWVKTGRQKIMLVEGHKLVLIANGDERTGM